MKKSLFAFLALALLLFGAALATQADNNLCHTVWAGQCTTMVQWQAGHCYANVDAATCDAIYSDVVNTQTLELLDNSGGASAQSMGGQSQQAQGNSQKQPQTTPDSNSSDACRPSIASAGHNSWLGHFEATVNTCGRMFGGSGSGGKLLDTRKAENVATIGDTSCSISVSLYERTWDKSRSLYAIATASPWPCDSLSFWVHAN